MEKNFLNQKYPDLQSSPEVESAIHRKEAKTSETVPNDVNERVDTYLERLGEIFSNPAESKKERRIGVLKDKLHEKFIIKPEEIPEGYFELQKRIAREKGHGDIEINDWMRQELTNNAIVNQTKSLDRWIDYLGSSEAAYPNWFKYFVFRSITQLGEFDKQKKEFKKRSRGTTGMFPDINSEALAYVADALIRQYLKKEKVDDVDLQKMLQGANFAKLYAHAIENITPASIEQKESIKGEWIKYDQIERNEEERVARVEKLCKSLQNHGTGWCTAGEDTARRHLEMGDFYVYYTEDKDGKNSVPRIAIRMEHGKIAEISGIEAGQTVESKFIESGILEDKMETLPGKEEYQKKIFDMKKMTDIEKKTNEDSQLTIEELRFLYEIDNKIEGFSGSDPRVCQTIRKRNKEADLAIIFNCSSEQILKNPKDISYDTVGIIFTSESSFSNEINKENLIVIVESENLKFVECRLEVSSRLFIEKVKKIAERLKTIEEKTKKGEKLSSSEINYLYRMDQKSNFCVGEEEWLDEIFQMRDLQEDSAIIFDLQKENIVINHPELINDRTRIYIGDKILDDPSINSLDFDKYAGRLKFYKIQFGRKIFAVGASLEPEKWRYMRESKIREEYKARGEEPPLSAVSE